MKGIKNENDGKKSLHGILRNGIRQNEIRRNGKTPNWVSYSSILQYDIAVFLILGHTIFVPTFVFHFCRSSAVRLIFFLQLSNIVWFLYHQFTNDTQYSWLPSLPNLWATNHFGNRHFGDKPSDVFIPVGDGRSLTQSFANSHPEKCTVEREMYRGGHGE